MSDSTPLKLTTVRKEKEVEIDGRPYWLVEMKGTEVGRWRERMKSRLEVDKIGRVVGVKRYEGMEGLLIGECLYQEDKETKVKDSVINEWPPTILNALYKECLAMNGLSRDAAETEKND